MKTGLFERILENIFFFQFISSLTSSRKRQIRTPFSEIYFYHLPSGQQKGCADSVLTGSFPGPPSGQIPVESCEHPPPYASGLGYLVIREVFRLTPRMIVHRGPIDHAIEWRVLAAFCCIFGLKLPKKPDIWAKIGTPFYGVFTAKIFEFFVEIRPLKNRSSSKPVSGRRPRAYLLGSPPPGRAAQCCDAFKAEVSFCCYPC